jgi:hypothetical protein
MKGGWRVTDFSSCQAILNEGWMGEMRIRMRMRMRMMSEEWMGARRVTDEMGLSGGLRMKEAWKQSAWEKTN